ncbi:MAG TPA: deoxyribodipyrimidine photo-lyase [Desulfobacterales bacterium]|nr:deoxyribodipyrimidine photo-lyase [Desulfobacterales bacterium]
MIQAERIQALNERPVQRGKYVLYWMQASQRATWNHALEFAIQQANERHERLLVLFGITNRFPEANARHYTFMLEGLREVRDALMNRGIQFVVKLKSPKLCALKLAKEASLVVTDRGYLRIQRQWRRHVSEKVSCRVLQVESDVVVPVEVASDKEAYSAGILRPKIKRHLSRYLVPLKEIPIRKDSVGLKFQSVNLDDVKGVITRLNIDGKVTPVDSFRGGTPTAEQHLEAFIAKKLNDYAERRSDPSLNLGSHMSPYLHFGQISPLYIALKVRQARGKSKNAKDAYLEELVVRRELSMNFVHYNTHYDSFEALPEWANNTLTAHKKDPREYVYSLDEWETARTHDPYWNAAQQEMVATGKMHNYMRMYWGKKILEWSETPEGAYRIALHLNNKYELDGRDPNGFAGVAWCFGKHDRAWKERPVFGKVRYMNAAGLQRKFDIEAYVNRVKGL